MSTKDANYKQGTEDARQGKGQADPNSFTSDAARKAYVAGYNNKK